MTFDIAIMLFLLVSVIVLLAMELLPVDVTALLGLVALVATGLISPAMAFSGFANEVIIVLACIFVVAGTLARSGVTQHVAEAIIKAAHGKARVAPVLMGTVAALSALFSNTSATATLMPATLQIAKKTKIHPNQLLMPLAFASILGGTCTLIGTSTNLASSGLISRLGLAPYSLFEFVIPGVLLTVVGIVYLTLLSRRIVPKRTSDDFMQDYDVRDYLSELLIEEKSAAIGDSLASLNLADAEIMPLALVRDRRRLTAHGNRKLQAGDKIVVKSSRDALLLVRDNPKISIEAESTLAPRDVFADDAQICEVVLMPQSPLVGKSLKQLNFYARYQVAVLAIYRGGKAYPSQIENTPLRVGDVLLLQGSKQQVRGLARPPDLWMLQSAADAPISTRKGLYALAAMLGAILLGATGLLPLSAAFLLSVVALVVTGCTSMEEAYASIEWRLLVLIASMSAFGVAMQETGTASMLADVITEIATPLGLHVTLAAFAILAVLLTQPMSNAAAALVLLPVAISTANMLGVNARPFAIIVTLSASLSFITPLEPASLLVFGVGKYRFADFMKVGLPLTLIVIALLVFLVPLLWPF
jgi:di/tricarboxylate transporter